MSISQNQHPIETGLGARPEPDEILKDIDLRGKNVLVTGGYSGIGLETTRALVKAGAHVHVPARRAETAQTALDGIFDGAHIGAMDLGDLRSVEKFADDFLASTTASIFSSATPALWPARLRRPHKALKARSASIISAISLWSINSCQRLKKRGKLTARAFFYHPSATALPTIDFDDMHFAGRDYDKWQSYGQSKTAKALQAVELDRRGKDKAFVLFPSIPAVFSRRCNAICAMRKWSPWAGPKKTARLPIWPPPVSKRRRKGRAQACLPPPHTS